MTELIQDAALDVSLTERKWSGSAQVKAGVSAIAVSLVAACSPLSAFNTLAPKDPAVLVARGVPYAAGERHKLDVYAPVGGAKDAPIMVFFYGGGWDSGRRQDYSFAARAFAARGFLTIVPDYRLYPEARFPDFLYDGALAVRWVRDHAGQYGGNVDRISLSGHSAGAYNAIMLALDPHYLTAAGVDPHVIKAAAGLSGPYDFLPLDTSYTRQSFGEVADLAGTQPINHVRADAPPIFLGYGLADTLVGRRNSDHLEAALKGVGAPVEVKLYPKLDHAGTVLALSKAFRWRSSLMNDMVGFVAANDR